MIRYLYEGNDVILELDGSGNQLARNVWGTSLIARNVSGTVLYYMYNGHADVTALIDSSGTIQATYYYDAFGNILESTGTADNPFKYAGYQYDDETGLYYLQSRYYDPVTARFLTEDTFRGTPNDPLSLNLYTYCHNEPLMYTDPDGHSLKSIIKKATSTVKKAVTTTVKKATTTVKSTATSAASAVKKTATSIATNAKQTASTVKAAVTTTVKKTTTQVKQAATSAASTVNKAAAKVSTTVSKAAGTAASAVSSTAKKAGNAVTVAVKKELNAGKIKGSAAENLSKNASVLNVTKQSFDYNKLSTAERKEAAKFTLKQTETGVNAMATVLGGAEAVGAVKAVIAVGGKAIAQKTAIRTAEETAEKGFKGAAESICFAGGTLIPTRDGYREIQNIRVGDQVYSKNPETGEKGLKEVKRVFVNETKELVSIAVDGTEIKATPSHPFWVAGKGWTAAGELKEKDEVLLYSGETARIQAIKHISLEGSIRVYNFEVADWHTYFVSTEEILVHNTCWDEKPATSGLSKGADQAASTGWKVGDDVNALTKAGNYPSWSTVKNRYWKNAAKSAEEGEYSVANLERMTQGNAPLHPSTGTPMELHHINGRNIPDPHNINNLQELWPWEHAEIDPFRYYNGSRP